MAALGAGELDLQAGREPPGADGANNGVHDVKSWHVAAREHVTGAMISFRRCRVSRYVRRTCLCTVHARALVCSCNGHCSSVHDRLYELLVALALSTIEVIQNDAVTLSNV